jgi:hypothetical protein
MSWLERATGGTLLILRGYEPSRASGLFASFVLIGSKKRYGPHSVKVTHSSFTPQLRHCIPSSSVVVWPHPLHTTVPVKFGIS